MQRSGMTLLAAGLAVGAFFLVNSAMTSDAETVVNYRSGDALRATFGVVGNGKVEGHGGGGADFGAAGVAGGSGGSSGSGSGSGGSSGGVGVGGAGNAGNAGGVGTSASGGMIAHFLRNLLGDTQ